MTRSRSERRTRAEIWGWGVLGILAVFLSINALWLYTSAGNEGVFEQDTGARLSDVATAYPTVTSALTSTTRISAILMLGLGLAAAIAALRGLRSPAAPASEVPVMAALVLLGIGVLFLAQQRLGLALYHMAFGALFAIGQLLVVSRWRTFAGRRAAPGN